MAKKAKPAAGEIDLGITEDSVCKPNMAEALYAGRIATGNAPMPEAGDPSFTPGVRQALAKANAARNESTPATGLAQIDLGDGQLQVCLGEFGFAAMTAEEFMQAGVDEFNKSLLHACRAGTAFWAAQEAVKVSTAPGAVDNFKEWIEQAGLAERRVYEAIRLAKFYSRLPEESRGQMLAIGKKRALLLASLSQEVIDQAAESGNDLIGKADLMTVAELKEEIASLKRREKNYEAEIERAQHQVKRLSEAKKRTTEFLLRTEEIREECMALQLGAELNISSLQKLFEEVNGEDTIPPEGKIQLEQIWVTAHVVAARAIDMVERMKDTVTMIMPERFTGSHILTPAEAERWLLDYPMIANHHAAEKAARQEKREAAQPRGPGRPKGSTNKAAG